MRTGGLGFLLAAGAANAVPTYKSFVYRHGNAGFSARLDSKHLVIHNREGHFAVERKPCNRAVVNKYWDRLSSQVARLPKSRSLASLASDKLVRATVVADGRSHGLTLLDRQMKTWDVLGRSFGGLLVEEARTCRGQR